MKDKITNEQLALACLKYSALPTSTNNVKSVVCLAESLSLFIDEASSLRYVQSFIDLINSSDYILIKQRLQSSQPPAETLDGVVSSEDQLIVMGNWPAVATKEITYG